MTLEEFSGGQPVQRQSISDFMSGGSEEPKKEGFFKEIGGRLKRVFQDTKENYKGIAQTYDQARADGDKLALPAMALSATAAAPRAVVETGIEAIKQILPDDFKDDMKSWLNSVISNPNIQKDIIEPVTKFGEEHPQLARAGEDVLDIAAVLPLAKATQAGAKAAVKVGETAVKAGEKVIPATVKAGEKVAGTLAKSPEAIAASTAANAAKVDDLVKVLVQGKTKAIESARNTLLAVETNGVKTFAELVPRIQEGATTVLNKFDDILRQNTRMYTLPELKVSTYNYVDKALKNLDELYRKVVDPEARILLQKFADKVKTTGVTSEELNNFARLYGTEIGKKGFSKTTGEALTSISGQMVENVRSGIKTTVKSLNAGDAKVLEFLDNQASEFIKTKKLFEKIAEKVSVEGAAVIRQNKILAAGAKSGKAIVKTLNVLTGGHLMGFMGALIPASRFAGGSMSVLDLQKMLRKSLIQLNKMSNKEVGNIFNKIIK